MSVTLSVAARNAAINAIAALIDGGSGAGKIEFRSGEPPASIADADSGSLLATLALSDPAFSAASGGSATAGGIASDLSVDTSGTVGYFRVKDSAGTAVLQGTVGLTSSGADIEFDVVAWVEGGVVAVTALTMPMPAL